MDVLKPWLAATIEGELGEALLYREDGTARRQSTGVSRMLSYDDGSNLRIPSAKKGPVVQITKFLTFEEPIQVTLSDSVIRVNAAITNQASQKYTKQNRRMLTEGTVGGLIQLHEFEIVATHYGPRDKRITLYVKDFKPIGSNGSGQFGVAPQAIESREGTKELLEKLADLRKIGLGAHSEQSASSVKSQPDTQNFEAGTNQESQAGFATQVPRSNMPNFSKAKPQNTSTPESAKSLAPATKAKQGTPLAVTSNPLQAKAAPQKPSNSKALLGLLRNYKGAAPAPEVVSEATTKQLPGSPEASAEPTFVERDGETPRHISLTFGDENASMAPSENPKRKREFPLNTPRKKVAKDHGSDRIDKACESLAANRDLGNNATSKAVATEPSINALPSRPANPSISGSAQSHPKFPLLASSSSVPKFLSSASSQSIGQKRVSRRDVKIPKDQEALLNRTDSWLPAEPGQREPTANIPISLLKTLNRKADLHAQRSTNIRKQGSGKVATKAVTDQRADSESDVPASSGQWPASPERDQLPPNSSSASGEHSDHSVQEISKYPLSFLSSRRQSGASISSHSILSRPPGPVSTGRFLRHSGSPSIKTPVILTPSAASSGGEESHRRFTCHTPGCGKSYKNASGLKYHVDRYHPSTGFFENFKCPVEDCTKSYASPGGLKNHIERHHDGEKASSGHSGSTTPITPGASTPMFPRLRSWSEREGGSGRKVVESGVQNDLDGVKVSNSMPHSADQGSRTSSDKEVLRQRSSMNSILKSSLPPDAQPALVPLDIIDLNENHIAKQTFSPLLPESPTPDSDLEMTVPLALNEKTDSMASSAPMQIFPSTASQPQDPFTQVKRTPYVNGGMQKKLLLEAKALSSPLKTGLHSLTNGTMDEDTEFVSASVYSAPDTSTTETKGENRSSSTVKDRGVGNETASIADRTNGQNMTASLSEKNNGLIAEVQHESRKAMAAAGKSDDSSLIMAGSLNQSSGMNRPSVASKAEAKTRSVPEKLAVPNDIYTDPLPMSDHTVQIAHETKRNFAESSLESPRAAKRQKRFKVPSVFTFVGRSEAPRDPLEGARQYRQDFLASRRSSESSTPTMSPTMPFTDFPGTKSENPRDPSERAWQFRQDFLASRRTSETSTPTSSPGLHVTRLPVILQAEQRSVEVQNNVEKETVQVQSVDTMTEREKLIELSLRSEKQATKSDAAPLRNGTPSMKPDHDDAKPGVHDSAFFGYEAENIKLVADKGSDAESSMVIEPSSHPTNDEKQRAQSVEFDDFLHSPHQQADTDLAKAEDEVNETLKPGSDLAVASHDEVVNTNVNDWTVDPKSDKPRKELPTRASVVAEQGSNAPTPEMMLTQVAEPDIVLDSLHPQLSIEGNGDARMLDKTASELPSKCQALTVATDTPLANEVRKEPTSQQGLIGVDTPMPDVNVDRAITPCKSIALMGQPTDQSDSILFVVPAMVAESNVEYQTHLSPAVAEPAISLSNPRSDPEVGPAEKHQHVIQPAVGVIAQRSPSVPQNIFDKFRAAYPAYPGDMKHFAAMCREIKQLVEANKMVHQSLWDDFIVRHKIEYPEYVRRCAEEAEDAVPYETFFDTEIEDFQYQKRVINRRNLDEALALIAQKPSTEQMHVEPLDEDEAYVEPVEQDINYEADPATQTMHNQLAPANDDGPLELVETEAESQPATITGTMRKASDSPVTVDLNAENVHIEAARDGKPQAEPVKAKSAFNRTTSMRMAQEPSESRIVIDLTEDDLPDDLPKVTKQRQGPLHSNVSHLVNGVSIKPPPLRYKQDSSGSLFQVPYTSPAAGSHVPPPPQSMQSSHVPAAASTKCTTKRNGRSLPWVESDQSILQSSSTASDSQKRFPSSELREVRAKASINVRLQFSAESIPSGPKQSQQFLDICLKVIRSNWGIKPHELLEPEYCRGQVLSNTMIELLAEIAGKVKVSEARDRIQAAIDNRISDNAGRGAGHPSQERKMSKSDLELVRGIVETSSMSTMSPLSLPQTNTAVEKQNEGTPAKWWDDYNSPFKSFARSYASIRHGSGNSFAEAGSRQPVNAKKAEEAATSGNQLKMDITRWKL